MDRVCTPTTATPTIGSHGHNLDFRALKIQRYVRRYPIHFIGLSPPFCVEIPHQKPQYKCYYRGSYEPSPSFQAKPLTSPAVSQVPTLSVLLPRRKDTTYPGCSPDYDLVLGPRENWTTYRHRDLSRRMRVPRATAAASPGNRRAPPNDSITSRLFPDAGPLWLRNPVFATSFPPPGRRSQIGKTGVLLGDFQDHRTVLRVRILKKNVAAIKNGLNF